MNDMKKLTIVLTIIYVIAISGSVVYSLISNDMIENVKSGNLERLERQLQTNKDTDEVYNALCCAIYNEKVSAVKILLNHSNIDDYDMKDYVPLFLAIETGNQDIVNLLIDKGADIDGLNYYKETPVEKALSWHKYSIASMLIDRGAELSKVDFVFPLLKQKLEKADRDIVEKLVKIAADNTDLKKSDNIKTFFGVAVYTKNNELLDFLIEKYNDDNYSNAALKFALINSDIEMIDYIAAKGGNIEAGAIGGTINSILHNCTTDAIKNIIDNYDSADNKISIEVIKRSLWVDRLDIARYVLERGIDVNKLNGTGDDPPIFTAIIKCNPEAVKVLVDYNVPIAVKNADEKDVYEVLEDVRKSVDWFDIGNKKKLNNIYKILKEHS